MSIIIPLNDKTVLSIRSIKFIGQNTIDESNPTAQDIIEVSYFIMEPHISATTKKVRWIIVESNTKVVNGSYGGTKFEDIINYIKRFARDLIVESFEATTLVLRDVKTIQEKEQEFLKEQGL